MMSSRDLEKIKKRSDAWNAGLNALGREALMLERQRASDVVNLLNEVKRLREELEQAYSPPDEKGSTY